MKDVGHETDDFEVEIGLLQEPDDCEVRITPLQGSNSSGSQQDTLPLKLLAHLAGQWRASARRKPLLYAAIALSLVLLLAMVTRYSFPLSTGSAGDDENAIPPLPPGYNSFYMQAAVPWMQVFIDGHRVVPPRPGIDDPLTLKPGHHLISWRAEPFQPQSCRLSIPYAVGDSCNFAREEEVTAPGSSTPLQIILLQESLLTLPTSQQAALLHAIQASFDTIPDSQQVQPGERYLVNSFSRVATQPLQATLHFSLDTGSDNSCALDAEAMVPQPCLLAGQDCAHLCTIPWQAQQAQEQVQTQAGWLTFARTHLSWNYTTLQGQSIASNQPIDNSSANYAPWTDQLTLLSITWQDNRWHIHPLLGPDLHTPTIVDSGDLGQPGGANIQLADDPACIAAQDVFAQLIAYSEIPLNGSSQQVRYFSDANPAGGCVIVTGVTLNYAGNYSSATPAAWQSAIFLERFGVTLDVNEAAHQFEPGFPLADAAEKTLARQLETPFWQFGFSSGGNSR
ncbi:MAG TPA: hypothetical protein VKV40_06515 [Ktedonobacteraceae bacterium]|nr:hypothetical protein [Ktedonobacteraceae bacterium]